MVLPTVLHLSCIITSFLLFMAQSQCKINGVVCVWRVRWQELNSVCLGVAGGKY